jgi:hypothetical protein
MPEMEEEGDLYLLGYKFVSMKLEICLESSQQSDTG